MLDTPIVLDTAPGTSLFLQKFYLGEGLSESASVDIFDVCCWQIARHVSHSSYILAQLACSCRLFSPWLWSLRAAWRCTERLRKEEDVHG